MLAWRVHRLSSAGITRRLTQLERKLPNRIESRSRTGQVVTAHRNILVHMSQSAAADSAPIEAAKAAHVQVPGDRSGEAGPTDAAEWLADTRLLQCGHPGIQVLALRLTQRHREATEKALACFQHVRSLPFMFAPGDGSVRASEVVCRGHGDGRSKSTLLTALLRSIGIPARIRVVALPPAFLHGMLDTGGQHFNHVFTEVLLADRWLGVDTYIIDVKLALMVHTRLMREGRHVGYGFNIRGEAGWNGRTSAFGQFCADDPFSAPSRDWGVFHDVAAFCRAHPCASQKLSTATAVLANRRIRALRGAGPAAA